MTSGSSGPTTAGLAGIRVVGHKVIGAKHVREGRPCQDAVAIAPGPACVALAVADGHGSSVFAETGAALAVAVAVEALLALAGNLGPAERLDIAAVHRLAQDPLRQLLVREWGRKIREFADDSAANLKDYGSTLLFALVTPEFLLLGQLGDGDILLVDSSGAVTRPWPADPNNFAEETASLCLPDAWASLRVRAMALPNQEALVMLCTDGYSKSYPTDIEFERIGPDYLELVREGGLGSVADSLEEFLLAVTSGGSGDDIAVALIHRAGSAGKAAPLEASPQFEPNDRAGAEG
jgi:serine/threonine protein phosphatase PrpC